MALLDVVAPLLGSFPIWPVRPTISLSAPASAGHLPLQLLAAAAREAAFAEAGVPLLAGQLPELLPLR